MLNHQFLTSLGWNPFFQQQLSLHEWEHYLPARVTQQHKNSLKVETSEGEINLPIMPSMPAITVGDWLLIDTQSAFLRLLERQNCFKRKAAGVQSAEQLIAANIDTAFIVCSLNHDFNLNRIERYLSLIHETQAEAVVVLTKKDCVDEYTGQLEQVRQLAPNINVVAINGLKPDCIDLLSPWVRTGKTIVMLGSSGSGKSTLSNQLLKQPIQQTAGIREQDSKGRHITTSRSLFLLPDGGLLIDTPGMRELQLFDCENGVSATFADITELALLCRFSDCQHQQEPGCAVKKAIDSGELEARRLKSYQKLHREQQHNHADLAEKRAKDKQLTQFYAKTQRDARKNKRG
ncbi:ribosome small subunit-dependent GTPase A [Aliikangiella maris]|uniref:Small ribosomal subunit biogenesis GTPase RsgA n=2 Tax=Aliikangiella maris TaxID=3162458 RepID=A0ABV3MNV8_9GAMM